MIDAAALRTAIGVGLGVAIANLALAGAAQKISGVPIRPGLVQVLSSSLLGLISAALQMQGTHFAFFAVWPSDAVRAVAWQRRWLSALPGGLVVLGLAALAMLLLENVCTGSLCRDLAPGVIQGLLGGAAVALTLLPYLVTGFLRRELHGAKRVSRWALGLNVVLVLLGVYAEFEYTMVELLGSWTHRTFIAAPGIAP